MSKKVFVLLTQFPDLGSKALRFFPGAYYSHASIGLEEDMNIFYSFVYKGFIVEEITRYLRSDSPPYPCQLYEINVSEQVYQKIRQIIRDFQESKNVLSYTRLGLFLSLLHIPLRWRGHYFCSQFVAEVLQRGQATNLQKSSALYLPENLREVGGARERFRGDLCALITHFGLAAGTA